MNDTLDGDYQKYSVESGAYIRENFFGPEPELRELVEHLSRRPDLHACGAAATTTASSTRPTGARRSTRAAPTVILAKTVKGWTLGEGFEARNVTHQMKKLSNEGAQDVPRPPRAADRRRGARGPPPYYHPGPDSEEIRYMMERRAKLGGELPKRIVRAKALAMPAARIRSRSSWAAPGAPRPSRRRWRSSGSCAGSCARRSSDRGSCRSFPTRRAPSAWRGSSRSSGSTRRSASATSRSTRSSSSPTRRDRTARSSRRGSPRPARWRRSPRPAPPTRRTASSRSPSTSSTRCSASSARWTRSGPSPTRGRAAS